MVAYFIANLIHLVRAGSQNYRMAAVKLLQHFSDLSSYQSYRRAVEDRFLGPPTESLSQLAVVRAPQFAFVSRFLVLLVLLVQGPT